MTLWCLCVLIFFSANCIHGSRVTRESNCEVRKCPNQTRLINVEDTSKGFNLLVQVQAFEECTAVLQNRIKISELWERWRTCLGEVIFHVDCAMKKIEAEIVNDGSTVTIIVTEAFPNNTDDIEGTAEFLNSSLGDFGSRKIISSKSVSDYSNSPTYDEGSTSNCKDCGDLKSQLESVVTALVIIIGAVLGICVVGFVGIIKFMVLPGCKRSSQVDHCNNPDIDNYHNDSIGPNENNQTFNSQKTCSTTSSEGQSQSPDTSDFKSSALGNSVRVEIHGDTILHPTGSLVSGKARNGDLKQKHEPSKGMPIGHEIHPEEVDKSNIHLAFICSTDSPSSPGSPARKLSPKTDKTSSKSGSESLWNNQLSKQVSKISPEKKTAIQKMKTSKQTPESSDFEGTLQKGVRVTFLSQTSNAISDQTSVSATSSYSDESKDHKQKKAMSEGTQHNKRTRKGTKRSKSTASLPLLSDSTESPSSMEPYAKETFC